MPTVTKLEPYEDAKGNRIEYSGPVQSSGIEIIFSGKNNRLIVDDGAQIKYLKVAFPHNKCICRLGNVGHSPNYTTFDFRASVLFAGSKASVTIGDNVTSSGIAVFIVGNPKHMNTPKKKGGGKIIIGKDCMLGSGVHILGADWHACYDIRTGEIANRSKSIVVGDHVWLASTACILNRSVIGNGSIVGHGSIAKGVFPNNCIIAGNPAKVLKRNIAWERNQYTCDANNRRDWAPTAEPFSARLERFFSFRWVLKKLKTLLEKKKK